MNSKRLCIRDKSYFRTLGDACDVEIKNMGQITFIVLDKFLIPYKSVYDIPLFTVLVPNKIKKKSHSNLYSLMDYLHKKNKDCTIEVSYWTPPNPTNPAPTNLIKYNLYLHLGVFNFDGKLFININDIDMIVRTQMSANIMPNYNYITRNYSMYPYDNKYNAPPIFESIMEDNTMSHSTEKYIRRCLTQYFFPDILKSIMQYIGKEPVEGPLKNSALRVLFKNRLYDNNILTIITQMLFG